MRAAGKIGANRFGRGPSGAAHSLSVMPRPSHPRVDNSPLIYDLRSDAPDRRTYEPEVGAFAARLTAETEARAAHLLDGYAEFVRTVLKEGARSRGEYIAELLTLGMAFRLYEPAERRTPRRVLLLARLLLAIRRTSARLKPAADAMRARLFRPFLPDWTTHGAADAQKLPRLVAWLRASGEFRQEAARLANWSAYLRTMKPSEAREWVTKAVELFAWFERETETALGQYTEGVARFLSGEFARRGVREDQLFCGRPRVEYHLGMVASELMNAGLRPQFEETKQRAVLVPACMRGERAATCRAHVDGVDMTCAGCDPSCRVNRITRKLKTRGVPVYIIPHESSFSRWLDRWQREHGVGVVAVACLSNILTGGYEMRARGIASQCVVLDYPGCEKHWRCEPVATAVNEFRLVQIATAH